MDLLPLLAGPMGPLLIFLLRILDVSLSTVRMLLMVRGRRLLVPLLGFAEVLVWIFAVGGVVSNLDSPLLMVAYAAGFAAGNWVGLWIEERMALGLATVRTVVREGGSTVAAALRDEGLGVTEQTGRGREGPVDVLYSVLPRRRVAPALRLIDELAPESFVVVSEPRAVRRGWMAVRR
jgi:uncharacterized protein YebE (UPF0316 family)